MCDMSHEKYVHLPLAWEGTSVWDLPLDTISQPSIEQIQLEKAKSAKVCQTHSSSLCITNLLFAEENREEFS